MITKGLLKNRIFMPIRSNNAFHWCFECQGLAKVDFKYSMGWFVLSKIVFKSGDERRCGGEILVVVIVRWL